MTTTWKSELLEALEQHNETLEDIVSNTMTPEQIDEEFDDGWGGTEGCAFTVWTANRVYFPASYDGSEWVASVARNPDGQVTEHIGG